MPILDKAQIFSSLPLPWSSAHQTHASLRVARTSPRARREIHPSFHLSRSKLLLFIVIGIVSLHMGQEPRP